MAYCLQKLALGKDAMDHKVFILAFHTQLLKNTFDGTPRLRGMAVPSIDPPKQGARTRTWCKECDLAMCSPDCFNDFHKPLIKLPYIDTAPVAKKLLGPAACISTAWSVGGTDMTRAGV
eukprot:jgi/Mesvir1/6440/Mv19523-RA.1